MLYADHCISKYGFIPPDVRVWGTIGWIVAGLIITFIQYNFYDAVEKSMIPMKMAAIAMAAYMSTEQYKIIIFSEADLYSVCLS